MNRVGSETQVRTCNTAGFFGVVSVVALSVHICVVTNDLDGRLVGGYGSVRSKTAEQTFSSSVIIDNERVISRQRCIGYIVNDADSEVVFRFIEFEVVEYGFNVLRSSIVASKTVASTDNFDVFVS